MTDDSSDPSQHLTLPQPKQKKGFKVDIGTTLIIALALILIIVAAARGDGSLAVGLKGGWKALLRFLPLLIGIFIIIGLSEVLLPKEAIARWLGGESGFKGILIASGVGALTPGGPFVSFPLVATLYKAGAGVGPLVAFITAWSLWAVSRLPLEIALVGPRLTFIRLVSSLIFPPLAGLIANALFGGMK